MIALASWILVFLSVTTLVSTGHHLYRGKPKPRQTTIVAVLTIYFFAVCISAWNTLIPVRLWWLILAGLGLVVGYASIKESGERGAVTYST